MPAVDRGMVLVAKGKDGGATLADAALAIHTLPGQTRTFVIHVDKDHPLIDGVWMLGNTNDGFSGISGIDAYSLTAPMTISPRGYDAGSEKNNEKKGHLGALGGGNMRDPENGVVTHHAGIRGDVEKPVAEVTLAPLQAGL